MLHREDGVTLIEFLATVVLGGLLAGSLVSLIVIGFQSFETGRRVLADTDAVTAIRLLVSDDARSAAPTATTVSADGRTLTLAIFDSSPAAAGSVQARGFRTVVYQYVPCPEGDLNCVFGTMTRTVTLGTGPSAGTQTIASRLAKTSDVAVFQIQGQAVVVNVPLPSTPVQTVQLKALMRPTQ